MTKHFNFPEDATPIADCSGLIPQWVHDLNDLNRVEAENILQAQRKYLEGKIDNPRNWFVVPTLKAIHLAMFENVWEWAGKYRKSVTSVGVMPGLIPSKLAELCSEVHSWIEHPVELKSLHF